MVEKDLLFIGIIFVTIWSCRDLRREYILLRQTQPSSQQQQQQQQLQQQDEFFSIIKFQYCSTCGYRKNFEELSKTLHKNYPNFSIIGEKHLPKFYRILLAKMLSYLKMAFLFCLLLHQNPFLYFHISTPSIYLWALQNKMFAALMIFFFFNTIESYLLSTGAFEIFFNNQSRPIWSKLELGRLPTTDEFLEIIRKNL